MDSTKCTEETKKDHILQVTMKLIEEVGFEAITIRNIANRAGVNVALINYYFGSKDHLLNQAVQVLLSSLQHSFVILENYTMNPQQRLQQFLIEYVKVFQMYPSIIKRLLLKSTYHFESEKDYRTFMKALGIRKLVATLKEITGEQDEQMCMIMLSQLLGAVLLPVLMEPILKESTPFQLPNIETHISILFQHYFNSYK